MTMAALSNKENDAQTMYNTNYQNKTLSMVNDKPTLIQTQKYHKSNDR